MHLLCLTSFAIRHTACIIRCKKKRENIIRAVVPWTIEAKEAKEVLQAQLSLYITSCVAYCIYNIYILLHIAPRVTPLLDAHRSPRSLSSPVRYKVYYYTRRIWISMQYLNWPFKLHTLMVILKLRCPLIEYLHPIGDSTYLMRPLLSQLSLLTIYGIG